MAGSVERAERCWCFEVSIPDAALQRVPSEQQGVRCICRQCATNTDYDWPTLARVFGIRLARVRRDH
jgi:hypothetical protein